MRALDNLFVEIGIPVLGTKSRVFTTHPALSLDQLVPVDDFYRFLDAHLDLDFVRDWVAPGYAESGRPSIDPVVFFKLQLILFFEGLRSERQLSNRTPGRRILAIIGRLPRRG